MISKEIKKIEFFLRITTIGAMQDKVLELIKFDREIRYDKERYDADLFELKDIKRDQKWDYSLPTVISSTFFKKNTLNSISFKAEFNRLYNPLANITWDNICIVGGCISNILTGYKGHLNDIDIFIYADSDDLANATIERVLNEILSSMDAKSIGLSAKYMEFSRNKYVLNMGMYQVIFRRYSSISEILHGFDLGSSAVGYDGNDVYFTSLSKFAYEYGYNVVDTMRRSTTYEFRLDKYFDRGFGMLLPELDMSKVDTYMQCTYGIDNMIEFPFMSFTFYKLNDNTLRLVKFYKKIKYDIYDNSFTDNTSDYQNDIIYEYDYDKFSMRYTNLVKLLNNKSDEVVFYSDNLDNLLKPRIELSEEFICKFYDKLARDITYGSSFPIKIVSKYITKYSCDEIFANRKSEKLVIMIAWQKTYALEKLHEFNNNVVKINWNSVDPGTQLTSSFNPIIEDAANWYGKYYISRL